MLCPPSYRLSLLTYFYQTKFTNEMERLLMNVFFSNSQLSKKFRGGNGGTGKSPLDELLQAFEMAERSSPGVTELFVRDLLAKMVPNMTESRVRTVVDRMIR
jgi:serine/threonine-protein kinase 24/25/MST4